MQFAVYQLCYCIVINKPFRRELFVFHLVGLCAAGLLVSRELGSMVWNRNSKCVCACVAGRRGARSAKVSQPATPSCTCRRRCWSASCPSSTCASSSTCRSVSTTTSGSPHTVSIPCNHQHMVLLYASAIFGKTPRVAYRCSTTHRNFTIINQIKWFMFLDIFGAFNNELGLL